MGNARAIWHRHRPSWTECANRLTGVSGRECSHLVCLVPLPHRLWWLTTNTDAGPVESGCRATGFRKNTSRLRRTTNSSPCSEAMSCAKRPHWQTEPSECSGVDLGNATAAVTFDACPVRRATCAPWRSAASERHSGRLGGQATNRMRRVHDDERADESLHCRQILSVHRRRRAFLEPCVEARDGKWAR